jgi:hypothetical protein
MGLHEPSPGVDLPVNWTASGAVPPPVYLIDRTEGLPSLDMARDRARSGLESLLTLGLVDLYEFRGLPRNDATPIASERQFRLMRDDQFWAALEDGDDASVWYDTTERASSCTASTTKSGVPLYRR